MNVLVLGAGAIGSLFAARLSTAHDVTVLVRPAHADAINRDGLRLMGLDAGVYRVRAVTTLQEIPPRALVLITTKVNDNQTIAEAIAPLVHDDTMIVCVQNGLDGERIVRDAVPRGAVLRAITQLGAIFREPGVADFKIQGETAIERGDRSADIATLFTACGLPGRVSDDIRVEIWRKLIVNCVINPITSILQSEVGTIADASLDPIKQLVIDECLAVSRADGVTLSIDFLDFLTRAYGPSHNIASMQQDLRKGKTTEIDFMNGAVVAMGRRYGIACPVNAALTSLVKTMEGSGRFVVP